MIIIQRYIHGRRWFNHNNRCTMCIIILKSGTKFEITTQNMTLGSQWIGCMMFRARYLKHGRNWDMHIIFFILTMYGHGCVIYRFGNHMVHICHITYFRYSINTTFNSLLNRWLTIIRQSRWFIQQDKWPPISWRHFLNTFYTAAPLTFSIRTSSILGLQKIEQQSSGDHFINTDQIKPSIDK